MEVVSSVYAEAIQFVRKTVNVTGEHCKELTYSCKHSSELENELALSLVFVVHATEV